MAETFDSSRAIPQNMSARIKWWRWPALAAFLIATFPLDGEEPIPKLSYEAVADFFQLPPAEHFVEVAGVAVNSKGHIYVFSPRKTSVDGV